MQKDENTILENLEHRLIYSDFERIKSLIIDEQHEQAYSAIKEMHHADLADLIDSVSHDQALTVFSLIQDIFDPELLVLLSARSNILALEYFGPSKLTEFIVKLNASDAIIFLDDIDLDAKNEIIELLPEENRMHILECYNYSEHSAGRLMSKKYILFHEHWSVGQALDSIKASKEYIEEFHAVVVVNAKGKPVGTVSLSTILRSNRTSVIKDIANSDLKIAETNTSLSDLVYIFKHYALSIVPVINRSGKLVGIISIENMIFIMEAQAEDALLHFGGVNEIDLYDSLLSSAKQRFPWLFLNLAAACITSFVINSFSDIISKFVALAPLMQVVASMGGNATMQTMTITIMAITNKDLSRMHAARLIIKEFLTCGLNGLVFGAIGSLLVIWLFNEMSLAQIFGISIIAIFMLGGIFGAAVPIFLDKFNFDPAPSSGVIVAAIIDSFGFLIFLGLASLILTHI
ncbi:MAG: magnesium transporter [Rickettsiaceae bacterium]|nr:magnesium transporter [Rickettsiaceae bacterium]